MKKLLSLLLVMVLCFSACAVFAEEAAPEAPVAEEAVAEEAEAEAEVAEPEPETITVAGSFADYELTVPAGVSVKTKRKGDITTVAFGGEIDSAEVNWAQEGEKEELTVENGIAKFSHAGHKVQEGISYSATPSCGYNWFTTGNNTYYVYIGNTTFIYARDGKLHTIKDKIENANFFRSGVASTATVTWKRTVDNNWYPQTIEETYEDGEITKVVAEYKNDKGKNLVHYVVTFDDGDDGVYTVTYGANDKYYGVSAKKDDVSYINGSAKYKNRWVNSSTYKWAPLDAGLRDIADFATTPRVAE